MLYINHREKETKVLGPGKRYAIWLQGCKKRCKGCLFPEGRELNKNGFWISVDNIMDEIRSADNLTGVTISGGEPFLQATALACLIEKIKKQTILDIMVYSGYTISELRAMHNADIDFIFANIDILVDGEYVEDLNTNSIYRGSDNQVIHFLSSKYKRFESVINNTKNRSMEFVIENDELFIVGIPEKDFDKKFWPQAFKE